MTDTATSSPATSGPATSSPATSSPATASPAAGLADPRPLFAQAVRTARVAVAGVRADQFDDPTPCDAFDVRTVTSHLVGVLDRIAVIGAGRSPFEVPGFAAGVADDEFVAAFDRSAAEAEAVWADTDLTAIVTVPWTQLPAAIALMIYISEVTVHTWDLAVATGQHPDWDADVVATSLAAMQRGLPDEGRMESFAEAGADVTGTGIGDPPPFLAAVATPSDASAIERLVAWCGRALN